MATIFQEQDGSTSMRRTLAFLYALLSVEQLQLAVIYNNQWGFYGACLCVAMVLWETGMTTVEGVVALVQAVRGKDTITPTVPKGIK